MKRYLFAAPSRVLLCGLLLGTGLGDAQAGLGQTPTVAAQASAATGTRMRMVAPATSGQYTMHEVLLSSGTTVREYTNPSGIVFAVTWNGPVLPDLGALLGSYYPTFKAHTDQTRAAGMRRAPVNMERDGLVLQSMGHARNFFGSAYAPTLVPTGVSINHVLE